MRGLVISTVIGNSLVSTVIGNSLVSAVIGNSLISAVIGNLLILAMIGNLLVVTTVVVAAQNQPSAGNASATSTNRVPPISAQASLWPATTRAEAIQHARANAGRTDPLGPVEGFKPFPSGGPATVRDTKAKATTGPASNKTLVPPPPDGLPLQVPPPPTSAGRAEDLPVSELPVPPERPSIVNKLKLTGIIGQKAIFSITDVGTRRQNKWPRSLMLGAGEHFESVEVVTIGADSALLEENGEQTTKRLERIR